LAAQIVDVFTPRALPLHRVVLPHPL